MRDADTCENRPCGGNTCERFGDDGCRDEYVRMKREEALDEAADYAIDAKEEA